jgi:hypothetical protein
MMLLGAAAPAAATLTGGLGTGGGAAQVVAVADRCNARMINQYQGEIRNFDAHPPRSDPAHLNARLGEIADVVSSLDEEHGVLDSMCATETDKAPLFAQLNATVAWALALESDIAAKLNASCPAAAKALPAAMLAQSWLALAATVNDAGGAVPNSTAEVVPKIRTRAAAVDLELPAYTETSAYWRDQITQKAKEAVASCPSPTPSGSGNSSPQPAGSPPPSPSAPPPPQG